MKTVSLESLERVAERYGTDDSIGGMLDALRIASTLRIRRIHRDTRRRTR